MIDQKEEFKTLKNFKIGHSNHESETFLPCFVYDPNSGLLFADVAGLFDTSGDFVELINVFVIRKILSNCRKVRFIFALTRP